MAYIPGFRAEQHLDDDERTATFEGNGFRIEISPQEQRPFTWFKIIRLSDGAVFNERLYYSHLALARLLTEFEFHTVLEIGSRNGIAARAFEFCGKKVTTCEIIGEFDAQFSGDYLDLKLTWPVDAIWCSHVLEHQRYAGQFIDKMYDDLQIGGVLALTVPADLSPLFLGHVNVYTMGSLLYNLICAGFDCGDARARVYDWQISVLTQKKPNGIKRISFGAEAMGDGTTIGSVPRIRDMFPEPFRSQIDVEQACWGECKAANW